MKNKRQYKRFSAEFPVILQAITSRRFRVLNVETKDISASGAFLYTKEAPYIPDETRFILNSTSSETKRIRLKKLRPLDNCTGTLARSTSEGIAIHFNRPVKLFV